METEKAPATAGVMDGSLGLSQLPWVAVPGFEEQNVRIRIFGGKIPKTQSWVYVPLIASALGTLPGFRFDRKVQGQFNFSTPEQIIGAQEFWRSVFSRWDLWVNDLREGILKKFGTVDHCNIFHVRSISWTTTMVFGHPREFGILPHPSGKWQEDLIDSCLDHKFQNELFASILTIGQYKPSDESESDSKGKDGRGKGFAKGFYGKGKFGKEFGKGDFSGKVSTRGSFDHGYKGAACGSMIKGAESSFYKGASSPHHPHMKGQGGYYKGEADHGDYRGYGGMKGDKDNSMKGSSGAGVYRQGYHGQGWTKGPDWGPQYGGNKGGKHWDQGAMNGGGYHNGGREEYHSMGKGGKNSWGGGNKGGPGAWPEGGQGGQGQGYNGGDGYGKGPGPGSYQGGGGYSTGRQPHQGGRDGPFWDQPSHQNHGGAGKGAGGMQGKMSKGSKDHFSGGKGGFGGVGPAKGKRLYGGAQPQQNLQTFQNDREGSSNGLQLGGEQGSLTGLNFQPQQQNSVDNQMSVNVNSGQGGMHSGGTMIGGIQMNGGGPLGGGQGQQLNSCGGNDMFNMGPFVEQQQNQNGSLQPQQLQQSVLIPLGGVPTTQQMQVPNQSLQANMSQGQSQNGPLEQQQQLLGVGQNGLQTFYTAGGDQVLHANNLPNQGTPVLVQQQPAPNAGLRPQQGFVDQFGATLPNAMANPQPHHPPAYSTGTPNLTTGGGLHQGQTNMSTQHQQQTIMFGDSMSSLNQTPGGNFQLGGLLLSQNGGSQLQQIGGNGDQQLSGNDCLQSGQSLAGGQQHQQNLMSHQQQQNIMGQQQQQISGQLPQTQSQFHSPVLQMGGQAFGGLSGMKEKGFNDSETIPPVNGGYAGTRELYA
eukprot:g7885.t1